MRASLKRRKRAKRIVTLMRKLDGVMVELINERMANITATTASEFNAAFQDMLDGKPFHMTRRDDGVWIRA